MASALLDAGPAGSGRRASAMASYFCSGFCRAGSFASGYHGPPGARGAGEGGRGTVARGARRGPVLAGRQPPASEANPPASLALTFIHLLLRQRRARLKFIAGCATKAQLQRDRAPRPPPTPSVSWSGRQLSHRGVASQAVFGLNCCLPLLPLLGEQERRKLPRNRGRCFLL